MSTPIKTILFCAAPLSILLFTILPIVISNGLEINPDSITYLLGAQHISHGNGFASGCSQPVPNTTWAPGYSFVIWLFTTFGVGLTQAPTIISIITYASFLIGVYAVVFSSLGSRTIAALSMTVLGLHPVILIWQRAMLSDSLAWSFVVLTVLGLLSLVQNKSIKSAVFLGIIVGLSLLVRYAYIGFAIGTAIMISFLILRIGWKRTVILETVYSSIAFGILGLWLLRNYLSVGEYAVREPGTRNIVWSFVLHFLNWWDLVAPNISPDGDSGWQLLLLLVLFPLFFVGVRRARKFFYGTASVEPPQILFLVSCTLAFSYTGVLWILNCITKSDVDSRMLSPIIPLFLFMLVSIFHQQKNIRLWDARNLVFASWGMLIICVGLLALPELAIRSKWYAEWKGNQTVNYVVHNFKSSDVMVSDIEPFWYWYDQCPHKIPRRIHRLERASELAKQTKAMIWLKRLPGYAPPDHRRYLVQPSDIIWDIKVEKTEFRDGVIYNLRPKSESKRAKLSSDPLK